MPVDVKLLRQLPLPCSSQASAFRSLRSGVLRSLVFRSARFTAGMQTVFAGIVLVVLRRRLRLLAHSCNPFKRVTAIIAFGLLQQSGNPSGTRFLPSFPVKSFSADSIFFLAREMKPFPHKRTGRPDRKLAVCAPNEFCVTVYPGVVGVAAGMVPSPFRRRLSAMPFDPHQFCCAGSSMVLNTASAVSGSVNASAGTRAGRGPAASACEFVVSSQRRWLFLHGVGLV